MLVTACIAMPLGVARGDLPRGVRAEELGHRDHRDQRHESRRRAVDHLRTAGARPVRLQFDLGQSILAAGLTLSLLILPIVIVATREAMRAVPRSIREAAYALGATRWQVTAHHVLPYSTGGILTGMIIGLSRAIGETAPADHDRRADLHRVPAGIAGPRRVPVLLVRVAVRRRSPAMPIQMFNWVSRPGSGVPGQCGRRRRHPARHDAADERRRDLRALPVPQENQLVTAMQPDPNRRPARAAAMTVRRPRERAGRRAWRAAHLDRCAAQGRRGGRTP